MFEHADFERLAGPLSGLQGRFSYSVSRDTERPGGVGEVIIMGR